MTRSTTVPALSRAHRALQASPAAAELVTRSALRRNGTSTRRFRTRRPIRRGRLSRCIKGSASELPLAIRRVERRMHFEARRKRCAKGSDTEKNTIKTVAFLAALASLLPAAHAEDIDIYGT